MTADQMSPVSPAQTARWLTTVYLALARRSSENVGADYERAIRDRVMERTGSLLSTDFVETLIKEVSSDLVNGEGSRVLGEAVRELGVRFESELLRQFLHDLVSLALHDDWYHHEEGRFVSAVARRWDLHPADEERERLWSVMDSHLSDGEWTALHDLAIVYIALAHQSDDDLNHQELDAIARKVAEWLPAAIADDVGTIVSEALRSYAGDRERTIMRDAIRRLKVSVPVHQRAAIVADLEYIARADSVVLVEEKAIIAELARAWDVEFAGSVR